MSEILKTSGKNTPSASGSTRLDMDAIKMDMGELQEILRGLHKKGAIISIRASGEIVIFVLRIPGSDWALSEKTAEHLTQTLMEGGKSILPDLKKDA